jgi:hypothetical protein
MSTSITTGQKTFNFSLLTAEWLLVQLAILVVLKKHWALLTSERGGPFSLVVFIAVGMILTWMWADVWQLRRRVIESTASGETLHAVQRSFHFTCFSIAFLTVAFGLFLSRLG